jgi:colanic acid biosynthesis glycosyl transferase WcaI
MSKKRHITIITPNYFPEDTAIGLYTTQFSRFLIKKGFDITVLTGFPCYPQWSIYENYRLLPDHFEETIDGVKIIRHKQYVPKEVTFKGRIRMMLSFFIGTFKNIFKITKTDLVITIIPYTLTVVLSAFLAKRRKAKLWVHIQDFEFDLALDSGIIKKNSFFLKMFQKCIFLFEKKALNRANVVSSISFKMLEKIQVKSNQKEPYYFPNWVSSEKINPNLFSQHRYISKDKFTLLYSGNIGEKQDWPFLKSLCKKFVGENTIEIVIVGDGSYKKKLQNDLSQFSFVSFYDPLPFQELNDLLCSADLHFLFQKTEVIDTIMPSKILGMMASQKPSIITGNKASEVFKIVEDSKGGSFFYNNNVDEVYLGILKYYNNPSFCEETGINARKFILTDYSEEKILNDLYSKIDLELGNT